MDVRDIAAKWPQTPRLGLGFTHAAVLYSGTAEYLSMAGDLARQAAAAGAPLHVAVPGDRLDLVREALRFVPVEAVPVDMADLGRNPARVIPAVLSLAAEDPGEHLYCLWEPAWPGRSAAELREVARHETLCNLAFGDQPMTIVCFYDSTALGHEVVGHAECSHPLVVVDGQPRGSLAYHGAGLFPPGCDDPLTPPAADAEVIEVDGHLDAARSFCARHARAAGLDPARITDFVIAISELAANAHRHGGGAFMIRAWCADGELLCQVEDRGYIADPLAASQPQPSSDGTGGYGLWLINTICDLVERRTRPVGTTTRLHMRRPL
jgi:anti-sigma regulatory factor (Ser/Thr protein kinase)